MQRNVKKMSDKASNLPITARHASHLTQFILKRSDAPPPFTTLVLTHEKKKNNEEIFNSEHSPVCVWLY